MARPTVSVVIPTYNRADLLPRALDSIIAQSVQDWEILLVDDGSTDETTSLAQTYKQRLGERMVYIRQVKTGCCRARNRGIEAARGRFLAFLDSDDEFLPNKLERQLTLFDRRPDLGFVYSDYAYVDTDGVHHNSVFDTICPIAREVPFEMIEPGLCVCTGSVFDILIRRYFIATIVGLVRREVLGRTIRFTRDPSYAEEWLFYLQVTRICRSGFVDEPLCLHHHVIQSSARTSSYRNTVRMRNLLREMRNAFDSLTTAQRSAIRKNLAVTCRQLGYDHYHRDRYGDAFRFLTESFYNRPDPRTLLHMLQTALRSVGRHRSRCAAVKRHSLESADELQTADG